ncbi:dTDP-4-dehydrorhamnose reductase [Dyella tabacisoli]|uniref:dTDP-4-dehydrorhamnose reductase n=1 Tax=Dyella tabacisoli TaxID=2282381 RepID=A0A369UIL7_9GAMM|nr:dTDP-4-dehydrorhamnose reductase [Dyella tabacisoli]RDD80594.1 dTDP-4-dehydrorhamnose reductase [Dyella tabacisoli]
MKILLLGANGQLGRTFLKDGGLAKYGTLIPASRDGSLIDGGHGEVGDLTALDNLVALLDRIEPDIIVNAAAYTAVDRAEQEEALATLVNGTAIGAIAEWAAKRDALVLHYSTDYVFDGQNPQPYAVEAATAPLGAYGRSKLAGELALKASGVNYLNFRTAWVYASHGQNFLRTMLRLGAERDELRVVADQHGAPTSTNLIVRASLAALDRWLHAPAEQQRNMVGTHHLVASGATTWHGFATAIFDEALTRGLLERKPRVLAIGTADFPTPAKRPAYSVLDNTGFKQHFGLTLPDWRAGLSEVINELSTKAA